MTDQPMVSLVMTTNNRPKWIKEAIESIVNQLYPDWELILWDDGSEPAYVKQLLADYFPQESRIKPIEAPHQGRTLSLKQALEKAQGQYIGWVDDDDRLVPETLGRTVAALDQHPDAAFVYTQYEKIDALGRLNGPGKTSGIPFEPRRMLVEFITPQFRLIRKQHYEAVGGLDESLHLANDFDLCQRLVEKAPIVLVQKPLYHYRIHPNQLSNRNSMDKITETKRVIQNTLARNDLDQRFELRSSYRSRFSLVPKPEVLEQLERASAQSEESRLQPV